MKMAAASSYVYKTRGRGRGILGLTEYIPCRRPGCVAKEGAHTTVNDSTDTSDGRILIVRHNYVANTDQPGGFKELSIVKGQEVILIKEHPSNEHWWEVRNEDGQTGFVPASYVMIRQAPSTSLPWLSQQVMQQAEEERKERAVRLKQVKSAADGKGFGPLPRTNPSSLNQSVSTLKTQSGKENYCDVCNKQLNGPIPFKAHLASKAHREEVEALESYNS